jgi:hypothetical protein
MYRPLHVKNKLEIMPKGATKSYFQWLCYQASRYSIDAYYDVGPKGPFVTYNGHNYYIYTPAASTVRKFILKAIWNIRNQNTKKNNYVSNMTLNDFIVYKFKVIQELISNETDLDNIKKIISQQLGRG